MTPEREAELREDYDVCMGEDWTARRFLDEALDAVAALRTDRDFWEEERRKAGNDEFERAGQLAKAEAACERLRTERDAALDEVDALKGVLVEKLCDCIPNDPRTRPERHNPNHPICPYRATMLDL